MPANMNKTHALIATLITLVVFAGSIAIAYGADKTRLEHVENTLSDHEDRIRDVERLMHIILEVRSDVKVIKEKLLD